ncbi:hypothetical protein [Arsenicibacter rosenii]|nr:hypothetical protein [Arsenicibacter rosenii]
MEIHDELEIEIFNTIEQIKRMNEAIHRHEQSNDPNPLMIEQFQEIRNRLTSDLQRLMSEITETTWVLAA